LAIAISGPTKEEKMTQDEFLKLYPDAYPSDVRWGEMDSLHHVNNVNFFRFFECARMIFWERLEKEVAKQVPKDIGPILASTSCRFRRPLYYPDKILIGAKTSSIQEDRFTVEHAVWSKEQETIVAEGDAIVVSFDYKTQKKVPLPEAWRRFMEEAMRNAFPQD